MSTIPETPIVYKYFDLIDEFIKVRVVAEEGVSHFLRANPISNKREYRRKILEACVVDLQNSIISQIQQSMPEELSIAEDLLYQICIDVNPRLEIHQVSIPAEEQEFRELPSLPSPTVVEDKEEKFQRKAANIEKELARSIVGQDEAIHTIARSVKKSAAGIAEPNRPIGCFLLIGKTGTGKTAVAKAISKHLFDGPGGLIRIDCSEFAMAHEYAKLIGAPPGYIGHGDGGMLTESIRKRPDAVVLFDEIEKAHHKVYNLLLQVLDEGQLTDSKGRVARFDRALILMTSNIGVDELRQAEGRMGFDVSSRALSTVQTKQLTQDALKKHFSPEFLNRIDEIVLFNNLNEQHCVRIAEMALAEISGRTRNRGIVTAFSQELARRIAKEGFSEEYGAREIRRIVKREVEDQLAAMILDGELKRGQRLRVKVRNSKPNFCVEGDVPEAGIDSL